MCFFSVGISLNWHFFLVIFKFLHTRIPYMGKDNVMLEIISIILISAWQHHCCSHVVICDPISRHSLMDWGKLHHRLEYSTLFVTKLLRHSSLPLMLSASPIYTPQRGDCVLRWLYQIPNSSSLFCLWALILPSSLMSFDTHPHALQVDCKANKY